MALKSSLTSEDKSSKPEKNWEVRRDSNGKGYLHRFDKEENKSESLEQEQPKKKRGRKKAEDKEE